MAKDKKKKKDIIVLDKADIEGRKKALQKAMLDIEEAYGKGSIMRLGEYKTEDIEVIPTGALALDVALGVGGIPRRKNYRNIWTRKLRKNYTYSSYCCRSTKNGRRSSIYRCRTCT